MFVAERFWMFRYLRTALQVFGQEAGCLPLRTRFLNIFQKFARARLVLLKVYSRIAAPAPKIARASPRAAIKFMEAAMHMALFSELAGETAAFSPRRGDT